LLSKEMTCLIWEKLGEKLGSVGVWGESFGKA
jgi:hypothetical protein